MEDSEWQRITLENEFVLRKYQKVPEHFYANLSNGEVPFTNPIIFNDPFEIRLDVINGKAKQ